MIFRGSAPRWGGDAIFGFEMQRLLDPFEKEFDVPATPIPLGAGQNRHGEVVGQEESRGFRWRRSQCLRAVGWRMPA
jgi:hypothetical protein